VISFSLVCSRGHEFEGWFSNSTAFEKQAKRGDLSCPICGSAEVTKGLMTPAIATGRKGEPRPDSLPMPLPGPMPVAAHIPPDPESIAALKKLRQKLTENAEYVGKRFPEEARKIHYNEVEKRGIYGEATPDQARSLAEEGIEFHPLPVLPEDHN
jgi:hypothetical protein